MRYLLNVRMPHEPFNTMVREGTAGAMIGRVLEETKPESIYFTEQNGCRGAVAIYNIDKPADVPALSEPWFLAFNADIQFNIAMTPDDLRAAKLDELGKHWK